MNTKVISCILLIFISINVKGQLAIINDRDGYTNIRESEKPDSRIIGRVFNDDIFLYDNEDTKSQMVFIAYCPDIKTLEARKKEYYAKQLFLKKDFLYFQGYINRSRLCPIKDMKSIPLNKETRIISNNSLSIINDSIQFSLKIAPFIEANHIIHRDSSGIVDEIDKRQPCGVDGELPKLEIAEFKLNINGTVVYIPKDYYLDLYNVGINSLKIYFDTRNNIIIYMPDNSDGSGGFSVAWLIKDRKFLKRYVDGLG